MAKLKQAELDELLKSERADGLVILNPEDAEDVAATIEQLRAEVSRLKGTAKPAPKKAKK